MKTIDVKISNLKPAEYNPRARTEDETKNLKESLKEWSQIKKLIDK